VTNLQDKTIDKIKSFNKEDWSSAYQNVEKELTKEPLIVSKGNNIENLNGSNFAGHLVKVADNFSYLDPVDNSISENQGLRLVLDDNSRVIVRLSGTGTKGATLRLYFEKFFNPQQNLSLNPQVALKPLIDDLDHLLNISKLTQMETPTVIT